MVQPTVIEAAANDIVKLCFQDGIPQIEKVTSADVRQVLIDREIPVDEYFVVTNRVLDVLAAIACILRFNLYVRGVV